jgi:hypothetical protein
MLFVLAAVFIGAVIFIGVDRISEFLLPKLILSSQLLIVLFILCIYPLSRINRLRASLIIPSMLISYLIGACAWGYSLLFVMTALGLWGVFFCFLFQTLTPITIIGAILKGSWDVVGNLSLWIIVSFMIKLFSASLRVDLMNEKKKEKIIDIEPDRVIDI